MARDADAVAVRDDEAVAPALSAKEAPEEPKTGIAGLIQKVTQSRPVRVLQHYTADGGPLLAAGMSYNAIFATFAALWVTFSIAGFIIADNPTLQQALFDAINSTVPGLVVEGGVIDPKDLLSTGTLSWTGSLALIGLVLTALGFLASLRDSIRRIFDLPSDPTFFLVRKAWDLLLALGFGVLILISAVLSIVTNAALSYVFDLLSIDTKSPVAIVLAKAIGYLLVFLIDFVTVAAAFRILSAIPIPPKRLAVGAAIGAAAIGILKALFGLGLVGGVGTNPLLAGFAVIIGLLIFFNFFCQALLLSASWINVGMRDAGIVPSTLSHEETRVQDALRLEEARRLVADANHRAAEQEYRSAHGLRKRQLARRIKREVRAEARRRAAVPTAEQFAKQSGSDAEKGVGGPQ
jgi:membrane protein